MAVRELLLSTQMDSQHVPVSLLPISSTSKGNVCVSIAKLMVQFRLEEMKGPLCPGSSRGSPTLQDKGPGLALSHACAPKPMQPDSLYDVRGHESAIYQFPHNSPQHLQL